MSREGGSNPRLVRSSSFVSRLGYSHPVFRSNRSTDAVLSRDFPEDASCAFPLAFPYHGGSAVLPPIFKLDLFRALFSGSAEGSGKLSESNLQTSPRDSSSSDRSPCMISFSRYGMWNVHVEGSGGSLCFRRNASRSPHMSNRSSEASWDAPSSYVNCPSNNRDCPSV